jgi:hypothetical protein
MSDGGCYYLAGSRGRSLSQLMRDLRFGDAHGCRRSETGAASPPRQAKAADLQLFKDENQVVLDTSFAGNKTVKTAPQPACPAGDVPPESEATVGQRIFDWNIGYSKRKIRGLIDAYSQLKQSISFKIAGRSLSGSYTPLYLTFPIGKACPLIDIVGYWAFLNIFSASAGTSLST